EGLQRGEVDDVGACSGEEVGESSGHARAVVVVDVVPRGERGDVDPGDRDRPVDAVRHGQRSLTVVETTGENRHVVAALGEATGHPLRYQSSAAHEVRRVVGRHQADAHPLVTYCTPSPTPSRPLRTRKPMTT